MKPELIHYKRRLNITDTIGQEINQEWRAAHPKLMQEKNNKVAIDRTRVI